MTERNPVRERAVYRPAGRGAGRRDRQRDFECDGRVEFETAELLRPGGTQQFRAADPGDDRRRDRAVALGLLGQGADLGNQVAGAPDQFLRSWRGCGAADRGTRHFSSCSLLPADPACAGASGATMQERSSASDTRAVCDRVQFSKMHSGLRRRSRAYCFISSRVKRRRIAACDLRRAGVDNL